MNNSEEFGKTLYYHITEPLLKKDEFVHIKKRQLLYTQAKRILLESGWKWATCVLIRHSYGRTVRAIISSHLCPYNGKLEVLI